MNINDILQRLEYMLPLIKNKPHLYLAEIFSYFEMLKNYLSSMLKDDRRSVEYFQIEGICRNAFIEKFGWPLLTPNNIQKLRPYIDGKTTLSVNSGPAFLEACIFGLIVARIICTDKVPQESAFMPVQVKDSFQAVVDNPKADVLLSSWPEYIMPDETSPFLGRKVNKKECTFCSTKRNKTLCEKRSAYRRFLKESYPKRRKGISRKQIEKEIDRLVNNYSPSTLLPTKMNLCSSCISSYNEYDSAYHALCIFRGNTFILIGEGEDGCTGSKNLFDLLEREWIDSDIIYHPNWHGIHSCVQIYVRK